MIQTPYDSSGIIDKKIVDDLKGSLIHYLINNNVSNPLINLNEFNIKALPILPNKGTEQIPLFYHPLYFETNDRISYLAFDLRHPVRLLEEDQFGMTTYKIRYLQDYLLTTLRTLMCAEWITSNNKKHIEVNYSYAGVVFSNWLGDTITSRYGLSYQDKIDITAISHYYWQTLFTNSPIDPTQAAVYSAKILRYNEAHIVNLFNEIQSPNTINQFIEATKTGVSNSRLASFGLTVFYSLFNNAWVGNNSRELSLVSLDHPPTFMAMVYLALTERSTKNSLIGRLVNKYNKPGQDSFKVDLSGKIKDNIILDI